MLPLKLGSFIGSKAGKGQALAWLMIKDNGS